MRYDILWLWLPFIVITLVFFSPIAFQESLKYHVGNSSLVQAFTSNYVHSGWKHYSGNAFDYVLIIVIHCWLLLILGYQRWYAWFVAGIFLVLPFIITLVSTVPHLNNPTWIITGASGLISALVSVTLTLVIIWARDKKRLELRDWLLFILVGISLVILFRDVFSFLFLPTEIGETYSHLTGFVAGLLSMAIVFFRKNKSTID